MDDLRREWDKRYTSNKGSEQLRDVMMEEYMKKKRMIKSQRNDRDEHEEYEKDFIEIDESESSRGRYIVLGLVLFVLGFLYFGSIRRSEVEGATIDDSPVKDRRRDVKAKQRKEDAVVEDSPVEKLDKYVISKESQKVKEKDEKPREKVSQVQEHTSENDDDGIDPKKRGSKKKGKKG